MGLDARRRMALPENLGRPVSRPGTREQLEVVGEGRRVAGVVELAQHLGVAELLAAVPAAELEQPPQEGGLVHAGEQEHVAADGGLDERIEDVAAPARLVADQRRGARVPAEVDVLVEGDPEGGPHLRERPVRDADDLEPAGEALGQALLHEEGRRSQQDHVQRPRPARVSSSHRRLTDSDQPAAFWTSSITRTAPAGPVSRRAASHCAAIHSGPRSAGSSALTKRTGTGSPSTAWATSVDLPTCRGPGDHLDEPPGLGQAPGQLGRLRAAVRSGGMQDYSSC